MKFEKGIYHIMILCFTIPGHGAALQVSLSFFSASEHGAPSPSAGGLSPSRVLVRVPSPQVVEQAVHSLQLVYPQSTTQNK